LKGSISNPGADYCLESVFILPGMATSRNDMMFFLKATLPSIDHSVNKGFSGLRPVLKLAVKA
jgi:hypothetical protein